ncbi:DMT family transporter [Ornithinimicrobium sp. F0845]|uniref:DMT family transporter n=1 Tax=Ornithinimicrobium sp. F0845 TaxID=2926412 RepID=UPI001FF64CD3|nr:DMT family transporter [Ornithinimicrobium sp. F0845]
MATRTTVPTEHVAAPSGFGLLVLAGLLWGTGGVSGAALAESSGLSAPAVATYRLALGGGLLVLVLLAQRRWLPRDRTSLTRIAVTGVLVALFQATYFGGVALASVSIATLVTIGSAPMIVVLVQSVRRRRLPTAAQLRPLVLGIVGLGLLVGGPTAPGTDPGEALLGILLALCAGASFALLSMVAARPHRGTDAPMVTGYGFLFGGLLLAVCTLPFAPLTFEPTARNLGLVVFFAVFPTALAWTLYFAGLAHAGPAVATIVALLEPLTATVLAVLLLGEHVTPTLVIGGALLLLSVVDARPRPVRPNPTP